jgi:gamma-glutamylaminecyclotransferase
MKTHTHLVLVYGTLMKDNPNNHVIVGRKGSDAVLLGEAYTLQKFFMSGGGFPRVSRKVLRDFPASVKASDYCSQVSGELWRVNDESLTNCDRLEGHPTFYRREQVPVVMKTSRARHLAWMYIITEPPEALQCLPKNKAGVLRWESPWKESRDA